MLGDGDEHGGAFGDLDMDMPRFLAREDDMALHAVRPPPLPSRRAAAASDGRTVALKAPVAVVLIAAGLVSVTLVFNGEGDSTGPHSAPSLITQPVPLLRAAVAGSGAIQVIPQTAPLAAAAGEAAAPATSSGTGEGSEARFGFAAGLAYRAVSAGAISQSHAAGAAADEPAGPAAMLFVSDLPEGATLSEGAPAGNGTWIVGASDPAALHALVADGFETPVAVAVEQLDASGAVSATAILTLHKPAVVQAPAAVEPLAKSAEAGDGKSKMKRKRKRYAKSTGGRWTASDAGGRRGQKRLARDDAYKGAACKGGRIARRQAAENATAAASSNGDGEDEPGVIAKFVGWLKGEPSKADQQTPAPPVTAPPAIRDDGADSMFGMFPEQ